MRRISEQSLTNAALFYLQRFSASKVKLRFVLKRKAQRVLRDDAKNEKSEKNEKKKAKNVNPVDLEPMLDRVVEKMVTLGYLDDARLANGTTASLRRSGKSTRAIRVKLRIKGVSAEVADAAVQANEGTDAQAVWTAAKKKRLGPFRPPAQREAKRMKDLAALARAGFSYALAKSVIMATEIPDWE